MVRTSVFHILVFYFLKTQFNIIVPSIPTMWYLHSRLLHIFCNHLLTFNAYFRLRTYHLPSIDHLNFKRWIWPCELQQAITVMRGGNKVPNHGRFTSKNSAPPGTHYAGSRMWPRAGGPTASKRIALVSVGRRTILRLSVSAAWSLHRLNYRGSPVLPRQPYLYL